MTNKQHPITPPPELVEQWHSNSPLDRGLTLATQAAQWGADQELDVCCEWLSWRISRHMSEQLRDTRRAKPPSLKEQALEALEQIDGYAIQQMSAYVIHDKLKTYADKIRKALEQLND